MDDDIDIEEHDVMDNPRIKSIFPDLSCVKIELPDDDEYEEAYNERPLEDPQEVQYQYEYSFETTTDDIQENNAAVTAEYEDDQRYFYNNAIILGSKPPPDPDVLYEEALNSKPIVYLENWGYKLKNSPCYCETCETLFPTVNALDAHKMISHSYLIALDVPQKNTARKSTVTSKYCNHCSKTFANDTSLIKHLYELLPLNNFTKKEEVKEENPVNKHQYMCQKCKRTFATHSGGKWHKKVKHPTLSHVNNLIIRIKPKKSKIEPATVQIQPKKIKIEPMDVEEPNFESSEAVNAEKLKPKLNKLGKFFATSSLVPKSTLFQCNVCLIGFMSCYGAMQHAKACTKVLSSKKCTICKRKIRSKEVKIHELQHNYTDKLKIYTVNKNLYDRVLCRCPKCSYCLDEIGFWAHYEKCKKSDKKAIHCLDCDENIASHRYRSHRLRHSSKNLTKRDFIIIEFHNHNDINMMTEKKIELLRKQHMKETSKINLYKKRHDLTDDKEIRVFYCETCKCCQSILQYKGHTDGACLSIKSKKYCVNCGLCFTAKSIESHTALHEKKQFSLKDIKIVSLTTGQEIQPPMPDLLKCSRCSMQFLYRRSLRHHVCRAEKFITCKICSKKFNFRAYDIHKMFHLADKLIPELMKKYNSITNMWNIVYLCVVCDLVTTSYDSAVNHSQGHLNYIISDLHKNCDICDLRIAEKDFSNHKYLHNNNESLNRQSFKILKYNYEDLFKNDWMALFKPLSKERKEQILSKSIYRYTRSVKLQIEVSAPTDDTKYFCMNCKNYVDGDNIAQHVKSKCARSNKYTCDLCYEVFKSLKNFTSHAGSHGKISNLHTIVTFNNECDQEFNNHLSLIEAKCNKAANSNSLPSKAKACKITKESVKKTFKIYKCAKCLVCINLKHNVARHNCVKPSARTFCEKCQEFYCSRAFPLHRRAHIKKPSVNKDTLTIVYFNGANKKLTEKKFLVPSKSNKKIKDVVDKKNLVSPSLLDKPQKKAASASVAKIYECECGLHFTSMKTLQKHFAVCGPDLEVSKEVCSQCNLLFSTDILVTHLVNHHSKDVKIVTQKVDKVNFIKCPHCLLLFVNEDYFNDHVDFCDPVNGRECRACHLSFDKKCFYKHKCVTNNESSMIKITMGKKAFACATVHKCGICNICYLQYKSLVYHLYKVKHLNKATLTTCDDCGLRFTSHSYQRHLKIHSFRNEEYRIKVIDAITGECQSIVGYNRNITNETSDNDVVTPKKRAAHDSESDNSTAKKVKIDEIVPERKSSRIMQALDKASTSKDSIIDSDDDTSEITNNIHKTIHESDEVYHRKNKLLSPRLKSRIFVNNYDNHLYKCIYCGQHFMKAMSFYNHLKAYMNHTSLSENFKCDLCDLDFSKSTLPRHRYVHHQKMRLNKEDFVILHETSYTKESKLFEKIEALITQDNNVRDGNVKNVLVESVEHRDDSDEDIDENNDTQEVEAKNVDSNLSESENGKEIDVSIEILDNTDDSNIETAEKADVNNEINNERRPSEIDDSKVRNNEQISYYKCLECNVCFINHKKCYEHNLKHEILDPKLYIQCKICSFQFMIDSLKEHMDLHHNKDFLIENLTIHDYKCMGNGLEPKIDVYLAVDKVQSRLVSTTTDVGLV